MPYTNEIVFFIAYILLVRFGEQLLHLSPDWKLYLFYPAFCVGGILLFQKIFMESWQGLRKRPLRVIAIVTGCFILNIILASVLYAVQNDTNAMDSINDQRIFHVIHSHSPLLTLPVLGVMGVVVEELIFRYILIGQLAELFNRKWTTGLLVVLSATLFGLYHVHNMADLSSAPMYIASGLSFGIAYVATGRNILATIIWHSGNNVLGLLGMLSMNH